MPYRENEKLRGSAAGEAWRAALDGNVLAVTLRGEAFEEWLKAAKDAPGATLHYGAVADLGEEKPQVLRVVLELNGRRLTVSKGFG